MLETAKYMLEFGISPEAEMQLDTIDLNLDWKSLSSVEQRRLLVVSLGSRKKQTYRVIDGRTPV